MNAEEGQAAGRGLRGEEGSVAGLEEPADPVGWDAAPGGVGEDAADGADHPSQKGLAAEESADLIAGLLDSDEVEDPHRGLVRGKADAEHAEVAAPRQKLRGAAHLHRVRTARDRSDEGSLLRRHDPRATPAVEVLLPRRVAAGVETGRRLGDRQNPDVGRQVGVDAVANAVGIAAALEVEVHDLALGVHSRVGPSGRARPRLLARESRESLLEDALNGPVRVLLDLPAAKVRPDVGEDSQVARHPASSEGRGGGAEGRRRGMRSNAANGRYSAARMRPDETPGSG